jgi:hypothetical protein
MKTSQYRKLRTGDWGIVGKDLQTGDRVAIYKRDGSCRTATVGAIVWTAEDGTTIARIMPEASNKSAARASARGTTSVTGNTNSSPRSDRAAMASAGPPDYDRDGIPAPTDDDYLQVA